MAARHGIEYPREMMASATYRIAYFVAYPQRMAGANRSLLELIDNLPGNIEPLVYFTGHGPAVDVFREHGHQVTIVEPGPHLRMYGKAALDWGVGGALRVAAAEVLPYNLRVAARLRRDRVDLFHANCIRGALLVGLGVKALRLPIVAHLRGQTPIKGAYWRAFELMANRYITVSRALESEFSGLARRRVRTVHNGTRDVSGLGSSPAWLNAKREAGKVIVVTLASVVPFKGYHHLIEAIAILNARGVGEKAEFVAIGGQPPEYAWYQAFLERRQAELGVDNLRFTGWQADPFGYYAAADISTLPSVTRERLEVDGEVHDVRGNEGFPRTHLEAMSFGLPLVGTSIAGTPEQITDGVNGRLVPPSDPRALADAMGELIESSDDRQRMGEACRRRATDEFSTDAYVRGVLSVYDELI